MRCATNPRRFLLYCLTTAVAVFAGCNALRIPQGMKEDARDWPTHARTPARAGVAAAWVLPPLSVAWETDLGSGVGEGSPLVVDSFVVVGTLRGELLVFHERTGKRLGGISFGDAVKNSPVVRGSVVYIPLANSAESIVAYDLGRGSELWRQSCGNVETSPLLLNGRLYAGTTAGALVCLDTLDGAIQWQFELPANRTAKGIRSTPASQGSLVVFGADDGTVYALDAVTGALAWKCATGAAIMAAPALSERSAAVGNLAGDLLGISLDDGTIRWRRGMGAPIHAGAVMVDGLVIVGTAGAAVCAIRESDGSIVWTSPVEGVVSASCVVSGSFLYVGTHRKNLLALRLVDGTLAWKDSLAGRVKTAPAVGRNRLVVATDDRVLRAYSGGTP